MLLKWIFKNKYKLMAFIIGLYVLADVVQHKGLTRVMLPKNFPEYKIDSSFPGNKNILINTGKAWVKGIDSKELMNVVITKSSGIEFDVYFDVQKNIFDVHHDPDNSIGLNLEEQLRIYTQKGMQAGIWLDLKNLDDSNYLSAAAVLSAIRTKYNLENRLLVESSRADLLTVFNDGGIFTSYYTPVFNPYLIGDQEMKDQVDSLSRVIAKSKVNALSGYYFQYPFLHHYFPNYPILLWSANDRFSLVNWLFKKKVAASSEVFIALYPQ